MVPAGGEYGTALQAASYQGRLEVVALLLERGANPNVQCGKYGTELQTTCVSLEINMEFVELLLKKGADLNAQDGKHGTLLQAERRGNLKAVQLLVLVEKGADPNLQGAALLPCR
ncbi:ankyrin repeat-containing domain protein [Mycena leptocephala]|nr:ankyrin repeat-containing domain protein [Mycena leptocephala]